MTTAVVTGFSGCNVSPASSNVTNGDTSTPTVNLVPFNADPLESIWQQWFAGVSDVAGKVPNFSVSLTNKETDSALAATYDGPWWATTPDALTWTKVSSYSVAGGFLTFSINAGANSTIYVASVPPHTLPRTLAWLNYLASTYPTLVHDDLRPRVRKALGAFICGQSGTHKDDQSRTVSALPMYGVRYGNDSAGAQLPNGKRELIVMCGTHAGEWHGFMMLQGFDEEWLSSTTAKGIAARNNINVYVYPAQAVGGMELGFRRAEALNSTSSSQDMNRKWGDGDGTVPTIAAWQDILDEQHGVALHNVVGQVDFHDATKDNTSDGNAYYNYMSGMANLSAIDAILTAQNAELAGVVSAVSVTTNEYFFVKGVNFAITVECRDERNTIEQSREYGRAVARAVAELYDQGYLNAFDGRALADPEVESFETGTGAWNINAGSVAWTRSSGTTPTTNTGADTAYSGSFRLFTEAGTSGSPVAEGATFSAEVTGVDFTKYAEMRFRWMRYGCVSSTLQVQVDDGAGWVTKWSTSSNLSSQVWKCEGVDLSGLTSTSGKVRILVTVSGANRHNNDQDIDYIEFVPWAVGSSVTLSPAHLVHAQALGNGSLSVSYSLAPTALAQAQTLDAGAVGQANTLSPAALAQAHVIDASALSAAYTLSPAALSQGHTLAGSTVLAGYVLTPNALTQAQLLASGALTVSYTLSPAALTQAQALTAPALQGGYALTPDVIMQVHALAPSALTAAYTLSPASLAQLQTLSAPLIQGGYVLTPQPLTHVQTLTVSGLSAGYVLTPAPLMQAHAVSIAVLVRNDADDIIVGDVFHELAAERRRHDQPAERRRIDL